MEDPKNEIESVVKGLIESPNAAAQKGVLQRYFAPDASFDHPLCAVRAGPESRDRRLLPIYQWLKIMFDSTIDVHSVGYDEARGDRLYVDATQTLKARVWPIGEYYAPKARLLVVLHLSRSSNGRYYIKRQEDIYQVQELPGRLLPFLPWLIISIKLLAGFNCMLLTFFFQLFGFWSERSDKPTPFSSSSSSSSSKRSSARSQVDQAKREVQNGAQALRKRAEKGGEQAGEKLQEWKDAAGSSVSGAKR